MTRLETGATAPPFTLVSQDDRQVSLADFAGRRVILFFYPAAMTPGCTTEAGDFRDALGSLRNAGFEVVGISTDKPATLQAFAGKHALTYPLLSDPDKSVLEAYGAYGTKKMYGKEVTGVLRSTVVIDEDGTVLLAKYNVRAKGHVAALAKALSVDLG